MEAKKVNLDIERRLAILTRIPPFATLLRRSRCRSLEQKITITEEEAKEFNIRQQDEEIEWDRQKPSSKEFELSPGEIEEVKIVITELDKTNSCNNNILDLAIEIGMDIQ